MCMMMGEIILKLKLTALSFCRSLSLYLHRVHFAGQTVPSYVNSIPQISQWPVLL